MMPLFTLLDNVIDYSKAETISNIISLWWPIVSVVLTVVSLFLTIYTTLVKKTEIQRSSDLQGNPSFQERLRAAFESVKMEKRQITSVKIKTCLLSILTGILVVISIFSIALAHSGRYTKQSIDNGSILTSYTYFGEVKNNTPHGFGKIFNDRKIIEYVGTFNDGSYSGEGKKYLEYKDGTVFLNLKGQFKNGELNGEGEDRVYCNGMELVTYKGHFVDGTYDGYGEQIVYLFDHEKRSSTYKGKFKKGKKNGWGVYTEYRYDELKEGIEYSYEGGWVGDRKYGYGEELVFNEYWKLSEYYEGTFWNDNRYGEGILELYNGNGEPRIIYGWFENNIPTKDNMIYGKTKEGKYSMDNDTVLRKYTDGVVTNDEHEGDFWEWQYDDERFEELQSKWPYPIDYIWKLE